MLEPNQDAPQFSLPRINGEPYRFESRGRASLLVFLQHDCPTCLLALPYLDRFNRLLDHPVQVIGISQDGEQETRDLVRQMQVGFPVLVDTGLAVSKMYDPTSVPGFFLIRDDGKVLRTVVGFDKEWLNETAAEITGISPPPIIADLYDGAPQTKPGCSSRHLEVEFGGGVTVGGAAPLYASRSLPATRITLADEVDPYEYCLDHGFDCLPVVPPTVERVERMLAGVPYERDEVIARVAPNYGLATVEKIAANAVMAGCRPELMQVIVPLVRAACDERFNLHGVQATTHFAAPLIIVNGPIRQELGFASGSNVFSNVSRTNSSLGRAFQLILGNLGGARPGEIDMSTLGNPGKFSYCIAENEEQSPWEPLHVARGFSADQSALTLFAAESPRGVSEHNARKGDVLLKAISRTLATVWTYRLCAGIEALVVLCPEHVKTLHRDGFTKQDMRDFLFEHTVIPVKEFKDDGGEGTQLAHLYQRTTLDGEECFRKFLTPEAINIIVAGGTAGKFSAVIGSWATGPRGSQIVTYPI